MAPPMRNGGTFKGNVSPARRLLFLTIWMALALFLATAFLTPKAFAAPDKTLDDNPYDRILQMLPAAGAQPQQETTPLCTPIPSSSSGATYSLTGKPTITVDFINKVLDYYRSPAAGTGQYLYDLGVKYNIDPAFALAFFMQESSFGKYGMAKQTLSLGNIRCMKGYRCTDQNGGYTAFDSWQQGYEAWYQLITNLYFDQFNKTTVEGIIPIYAPGADHNDEQGYINTVEKAVNKWRSGEVDVNA